MRSAEDADRTPGTGIPITFARPAAAEIPDLPLHQVLIDAATGLDCSLNANDRALANELRARARALRNAPSVVLCVVNSTRVTGDLSLRLWSTEPGRFASELCRELRAAGFQPGDRAVLVRE